MKTRTLKSVSRPVLALAALAAMSAGVATVANAQEQGELPTARVRIDDLNLGTDAGAEHMLGRLRRAAAQVCNDDPAARYPLWEEVALQACEKKAITPPVRRLNAPLLTVLYNRYYHNPGGAVVVGPVQG